MSGLLDVEQLLDTAAAEAAEAAKPKTKQQKHTSSQPEADGDDKDNHSDVDPKRRKQNRDRDRDEEDLHRHDRSERRERDRARDGSRDRERDRKRRDRNRDNNGTSHGNGVDKALSSPRSERNGDSRRHSSRSRRGGGDEHRGNGNGRARSKSPAHAEEDRHYRPSGRDSKDGRDRDGDRRKDKERDKERDRGGRDRDRDRDHGDRRYRDRDRRRTRSPELTEDERDRRTVFVQQLAARLRTKELIAFFEKVGPVKEAQIVKDRVSGRSKGVGYVEFKNEESVSLAIQLTGQKLLGIPIIAQLTEAEKNRLARTTETVASGVSAGVPFHRLYVGNIHFSITEVDIENVFTPFGELEFVQLQKEDNGRSRGYGFVQFRVAAHAKEALEKMNGFDLAGRPIRVGLGNDKFTSESTANLLQRFPGQAHHHAGGRNNSSYTGFDRAGGRDSRAGAGNSSALDDTDVAGVNFNNFSRDALMRKLARTDETAETNDKLFIHPSRLGLQNNHGSMNHKPLAINVPQASRCVVLRNMFNVEEEEAKGENWVKDLEREVKIECEEKYGKVVHIAVDTTSEGSIYVKFETVQGGDNAIKGLNGRFFAAQVITAAPVVDAVYSSLFGRTRAL